MTEGTAQQERSTSSRFSEIRSCLLHHSPSMLPMGPAQSRDVQYGSLPFLKLMLVWKSATVWKPATICVPLFAPWTALRIAWLAVKCPNLIYENITWRIWNAAKMSLVITWVGLCSLLGCYCFEHQLGYSYPWKLVSAITTKVLSTACTFFIYHLALQ